MRYLEIAKEALRKHRADAERLEPGHAAKPAAEPNPPAPKVVPTDPAGDAVNALLKPGEYIDERGRIQKVQ